jgi:large subunit ribosomal protein L16
MLLQAPRRARYRKSHKLRIRPINYSKGASKFITGDMGLKGLKACRLYFRPMEASRRVISRVLKKKARIWIRPFPHTPLTKKPDEIRMGKGKGAVHSWAYRLQAGDILFEINNLPADNERLKTLQKAGKKLPAPTALVARRKPEFKK